MTAQPTLLEPTAAPPPPRPALVLTWVQRWLTPRSQARDAAFRERVLRATLLALIALIVLSFAFTLFAFEPVWTPISFLTIHIYAIIGFLLAAWSVGRGQVVAAGWLTIGTALLASALLLILGHTSPRGESIFAGMPAFLITPVIAALILSQRAIFPITMASWLMFTLASASALITTPDNPVATANLEGRIGTAFIVFLVIGVLLRLLRVEFDARFVALEAAIRDAKQAKEQAERDRLRAEAADQSKSQFLANMSHEVRTPLNAIIGYNDAMLLGYVGPVEPKQAELLQHMQNNSRRLLALINDILDLSKIESGSMQVFNAPMSPRTIITETVESLRSLANKKQIDYRLIFDDQTPELVLCDAGKLQQILANLLSNAIKFTDQGGVTTRVSPAPDEQWRIIVQDTGIGMPPDADSYIFEPFRQVDGTTTRRHQGTGLGLAITRRLVQKLGGSIEVQTELDRGSTFTVHLPRVLMPEKHPAPPEAAETIP